MGWERTRNAYFAAAFKPESASRKKCGGGQRKSLKRRDSAKESPDFNLDFVPPDLESVPSGLDFLPKNLDFLHPADGAGLLPGPRSWQTDPAESRWGARLTGRKP